jgi:hypothetical protein
MCSQIEFRKNCIFCSNVQKEIYYQRCKTAIELDLNSGGCGDVMTDTILLPSIICAFCATRQPQKKKKWEQEEDDGDDGGKESKENSKQKRVKTSSKENM